MNAVKTQTKGQMKADIEMGGMTEAQAATKLRQAFENFVPAKDSEATKMANWKIGGVCENRFPQSINQ